MSNATAAPQVGIDANAAQTESRTKNLGFTSRTSYEDATEKTTFDSTTVGRRITTRRHLYSRSTPSRQKYANTPISSDKSGIITADSALASVKPKYRYPKLAKNKRPMIALLIAAHNEELVLAPTIKSAIKAGMKPAHIYVVDDNSSDQTSAIARSILGSKNVIKVKRSGKGLALTKATKKFNLCNRYRWIHIADADGGFATNYFSEFRKNLSPSYAAATGYVKSLPGRSVSEYRVYEYTIGMEIHRRFQALTHTVSVIPGPTSCFRADVFKKLNFANKSLTEDFDVTLQIHRKKLGKVKFIPSAVAYTQDPRTVKDFTKQITRWNRGIMQGVQRHHIGRRFQRIDAYLSYQVMQNLLFFVNYFILLPILAMQRQTYEVIATTFLIDVLITFVLTILVAARSKRWDILSAFPHIYLLRWITLGVFMRAFFEIAILRRFKVTDGVWSTSGRRYKQA